MVLATRLLTVGGGRSFAGPPVVTFPSDWGLERFIGNPVIDVADNPSETTEQYIPAPIEVGGDVWCYVKGALDIYAWSSSDGGETFTLENGGSPVIARGSSGQWDDGAAVPAAALVDGSTIHIWYAGRDNGFDDSWSWGYATAPTSDPTDVTKYGSNPILIPNDISLALGAGLVDDVKISDVTVIGSTWHFYGYIRHGGIYKMIQATGTGPTDPDDINVIASAPDTSTVIIEPTVFLVPGTSIYGMIYTYGALSSSSPRYLRVGQSPDGETWDLSDATNLLAPTSGWESIRVYGPSLLKDNEGNPVIDSDRWHLFYSGSGGAPQHDNTGLAYLTPV